MQAELRVKLAVIVALAVLAGACGGGGVPQAEYDQKVAELALTQQDLVAARERLGELEGAASSVDDVLAEVEEAVLAALGLTGIIADPGRDRIDLLAEAVAATTEERDMLLAAIEAGEGVEGGATSFDLERLEGFVQIAITVQDWVRPSARPASASDLESIRAAIDLVNDEMLTLAFDQLVAEYDAASEEEQIDLLVAVAFWAVDMARAEAVR